MSGPKDMTKARHVIAEKIPTGDAHQRRAAIRACGDAASNVAPAAAAAMSTRARLVILRPGRRIDHPSSNAAMTTLSAMTIHAVTFDDAGNGVYRMQNGEDWIYPAEGFSGRGRVGGTGVRCLSPATQVLCHAHGYVPVEKDFRDMERLDERFGVELPPHLWTKRRSALVCLSGLLLFAIAFHRLSRCPWGQSSER